MQLNHSLLGAPWIGGFPFSVDNKLMNRLNKVELYTPSNAAQPPQERQSLAGIPPTDIPATVGCAELLTGARLLERFAAPTATKAAQEVLQVQIANLFSPELARQMCARASAALPDQRNQNA